MSKALPVFHAFTGCDTVSCFAGRGKKTAFTVWKNFPAVTDTFLKVAATPTSPISEAFMERLGRFVTLMYDRTSNKTSVNETRKQCLHRKVEHMMLSHQPGQPCYSRQTELLIKLVTVGAKHLHQAQIYLHQGIGDGFSQRENGSFSGRRFQMWPSRAKSYFAVGSSVGVEEVVPVQFLMTRLSKESRVLLWYQLGQKSLKAIIDCVNHNLRLSTTSHRWT